MSRGIICDDVLLVSMVLREGIQPMVVVLLLSVVAVVLHTADREVLGMPYFWAISSGVLGNCENEEVVVALNFVKSSSFHMARVLLIHNFVFGVD